MVFHSQLIHLSPVSPVPAGEPKHEPTKPGAQPKSSPGPELASSSLPLHSSRRGCPLANPFCRSLLNGCKKLVFTDQLQLQRALLGSEMVRQQGWDQLHQHLHTSRPPPAAPLIHQLPRRKKRPSGAGDTPHSPHPPCKGCMELALLSTYQ